MLAYVLAIPLVDEAQKKGAIMATYYVPTKNCTTAARSDHCDWKKSVPEIIRRYQSSDESVPNRSAMHYTQSVLIPVSISRSKDKPQLVGYWNYDTNKNKSYSYAPVILSKRGKTTKKPTNVEGDVITHIVSLLTEEKPEFVPCLTEDEEGAFVTEFCRREQVPQFAPDTKFGKPALLYVIYQQPKKNKPFVCGLTVYDEHGQLIVHIMNFVPMYQSIIHKKASLERRIISALGFTASEEHIWQNIIKDEIWDDFGKRYTMPWPLYRSDGLWRLSFRDTQASATWLVRQPHLSLTKLKQ